MKASKAMIDQFLEPKKLALAGVSRNSKKFGYAIYKELKDQGYQLFPINPNAEEIDGQKCFHSISDLPDDADRLFIVTPKNETKNIVQQAIDRGIKKIWIQQMSQSTEAVSLAKENKIELIQKECIFMFANPKGIHKFHTILKKFFGGYPK